MALVGLAVTAYFIMWSSGIGPVGNLVAQGFFEEGELVVLADFADPTDTGMGNVVTETGQVLRAFRVPVASDDELLGGIDRLSREIREKSGESLRSIRQGVGLAQATTASLDALRLYTEAVRTFDEGRQPEALPLLEEAVELDPEFAMAWRKIAVILSNERLDPERMRHASRQAYELRRRLTDREAGLAEAYYQSTVEHNPEAAIDAYRRLLDRYPDDPTALNNVAVMLRELGRWDESEAFLRQVASSPTPSANSLGNFIQVLWNVGKQEEAWSWQDSLAARYPRSLVIHWVQTALLAGDGRWAETHEAADDLWRDAPPGGLLQVWSLTQMAGADLARGRLAEAREHLGAARRNAVEARAWELYWLVPTSMEFQAALALRGPQVALEALDRFVQEVPIDSLSHRSLGRAELAGYYALAGGSARARELNSSWEEAFAPEERGRDFRLRSETFRALDAWGRQEWEASAASFQRMYGELQPCASNCILNAEWGIALEESGRLDEALEKYRWHLADTQLLLHAVRAIWTPVVLERMARIHAARGEAAEARAADERIVEQFGEGDGPFVPFVERARERLRAAPAAPD
jgi:eukaryotic-like serine/threonine-protein kinase